MVEVCFLVSLQIGGKPTLCRIKTKERNAILIKFSTINLPTTLKTSSDQKIWQDHEVVVQFWRFLWLTMVEDCWQAWRWGWWAKREEERRGVKEKPGWWSLWRRRVLGDGRWRALTGCEGGGRLEAYAGWLHIFIYVNYIYINNLVPQVSIHSCANIFVHGKLHCLWYLVSRVLLANNLTRCYRGLVVSSPLIINMISFVNISSFLKLCTTIYAWYLAYHVGVLEMIVLCFSM